MSMPTSWPDPRLPAVLAAYPFPSAGITAARVPTGLIQQTYLVTLGDGTRRIAQRMHPIFGAAVLEDTDAVTAHLARAGMTTPRVVRTRTGALSVTDEDGRLWRLLTFVDGITVERVERPAQARAAAALVARFHRAVATLEHQFAFVRTGVHDTAAHLAKLSAALGAAPADLPGRDAILRVADGILDEARRRPALPALAPRVCHGDLKISNVLFAHGPEDAAIALIDLDTLGHMTLAYELGDAWRSWCNPVGEDAEVTRFDLAIFSAAVSGYVAAAGSDVSADELASLVPGVQTVSLELAARFCADALEDRYFGWDPARYPSRREHNRVRAAGQLALSRGVGAARGAAEKCVAEAVAEAVRSGVTGG